MKCYCLQNIVFGVLLTLGLLAGGIASAANAADIQDDYIEPTEQLCDADNIPQQFEDNCNDVRRIRDSQAAAAVSFNACSYIIEI